MVPRCFPRVHCYTSPRVASRTLPIHRTLSWTYGTHSSSSSTCSTWHTLQHRSSRQTWQTWQTFFQPLGGGHGADQEQLLRYHVKIPNPSATNKRGGKRPEPKDRRPTGHSTRTKQQFLFNDLILSRSLSDSALQALLPHTHEGKQRSCPVFAASACCFGTVLEPKHHAVKTSDCESPKM